MTPEWSHKILADEISSTPQQIKITATPQQCADLARRMRIIAVEGLSATLTMRRESGHIIHVGGSLEAQVTQSCVVTLEPVTERLEKPVEGWFSGEDQVISLARARRDRMGVGADVEVPVMEEREDPEPLVDGYVDLGELVTQILSLSLNPYPHAPGAAFERKDDAETAVMLEKKRPNPFAALKNWKFDNGKEK